MIDCSKEIEKFHNNNVRLPEDKQDEMRQKRKDNQDRLEAGLSKKEKPLPTRYMKQGSYAMHTMVLPPDKDPKPDYDIDDGAAILARVQANAVALRRLPPDGKPPR